MTAKMAVAKPSIPECPAYQICRAKKASCDVCSSLPEEEWKEHVKRVMQK